MARRTIVVAEDNPITRKMVRFALQSEGYEVLEAADGTSALDLVRQRWPDLVVQDYVLPDMDGLQLVRELRAMPGGPSLPVLMVTGMASMIDQLRQQAAGPTTVLPKPLEPSRLLEIVRGYLSPEQPTLGRGRRILVVDDEVLGRKLALLRLRDAGFDVCLAAGGEEALRLAAQTPLDAVLSDVLMPGLDGFALCRALRDLPALAEVPIVLVSSAFVEEADRELAVAMGANTLVERSADFGMAIEALVQALDRGAVAPSGEAAEVAALHVERVKVQLERQVARNEALLRQGAIQAAALSVVRGLAQALSNPRDIAGMLGDVLVHCLDAAGLSTGLLYLPGPDGALRLHAQAGLSPAARESAGACFGHREVLERVLDGGQPVACEFARETDPGLSAFGHGLGRSSCIIVPFVVAGRRLGALVIASDSQPLGDPAWFGFASALGAQFGQTLAVGRSMARGAVSEARYQTLLDHASDAILLLDSAGLVVEANRRAHGLFGRAYGEVVGQPFPALLGSASGEVTGAISITRPDRSSVTVEPSVASVDIGTEVVQLVMLHDVTQRDQAERELRRMQERLDHVLASSPAVLYTLAVEDDALRPTWVSSNLERFTGHPATAALQPAWWAEHVHPDDLPRLIGQLGELREAGEVVRDYRLRGADGGFHWIRDEQRLLRDGAGRPVEVVGSWWDVGDLKQAELRLEQSERQYRLLFDSNPHPMWVYDLETLRILAVNDAAVRSYGYARADFLAMTIEDLRPPEELPRLRAHLGESAKEGPAGVWKHRTRAGTVRLVEIVGSPIEFQGRAAELVLASDVTERMALQAQLLQSQKMEAVGQLAGGVAHDFNNLLGVITGYTDLLLKDLGALHPGQRRALQIRKAAERAADLTRQLLAFSRKQVLEPKVLDLNAVVAEIESMLRRLIGEDVELLTALAPGLGRIKADPGQLGQVIMNLAVNARDAMPEGGRLTLETADVELDEAYARAHADVLPGPYVMLAVSDTGSGMSPETAARIFEPFFTTKAPGKGTGLGLATVFGILKQSGGHVAVYSELGHGTVFKLYLPRVVEQPAAPVAAETPPEPRPATETVLVVEDAESLRELVAEILQEAGYEVFCAANPEEALRVAGAHAGPLDLVLTDVIMPGMDGRRMMEELRRARPELRALFMSGYTGQIAVTQRLVEGGARFLQKPFTAVALQQKVREALDAVPQAT